MWKIDEIKVDRQHEIENIKGEKKKRNHEAVEDIAKKKYEIRRKRPKGKTEGGKNRIRRRK